MKSHILGDIHGCYDQLVTLLTSKALVDDDLRWIGGTDHLWCLGDLIDRGPKGVECISLLMDLSEQAAQEGGLVNTLLGNHEIMLLATLNFSTSEKHSETFYQHWMNWGGKQSDMNNLEQRHSDWLASRPAMALVADRLLMHSDTTAYVNFGTSITAVNQYFDELMASEDATRWYETLAALCQRGDFGLELGGTRKANQMLKMFGGRSIVHGHSPSEQTKQPLVYADGLCCNVDAGLYLGNAGYLLTLD